MATPVEYKSVYREIAPGEPYQDIGEILTPEALNGWELVTVVVTMAILENKFVEVFYLKRNANQPA